MQELEVQRYLRCGKTVEDLALEFNIRSTPSPNGLVALNYSMYLTPMDTPLPRQCRALYLEPGTWNVASRSFFKFFNRGEPHCAALDWATARVLEKLDGSLVCLYHYRGAWHAGTRGHPEALGPQVGLDGVARGTFADLIRRAVAEMGYANWEAFTQALGPDYLYSFELTAPENRVLVSYPERRLTLLAAWDRHTLAEVELEAAPFDRARTPVLGHRSLTTAEEIVAALKELHPHESEGVVVRDAAFERVKIKCPRYVLANRAMTQMTVDRARLEYLLTGNVDDVMPYLPEFHRQAFQRLQAMLEELMRETRDAYDRLKEIPEQKDFALAAQQYRWSAALFQLRKGRSIEECLEKARLDFLCRLLGLKPDAPPAVASEE